MAKIYKQEVCAPTKTCGCPPLTIWQTVIDFSPVTPTSFYETVPLILQVRDNKYLIIANKSGYKTRLLKN